MMHFDEPTTELPRAGDIEIWEFINLTSEAHPMHVHLLDFRVLNRTSFRDFNPSDPGYVPGGVANYILDRQAGTLQDLSFYLDLSSNGVRNVQVNELGPKDVVHAAPWAVTRIVMQWPTNEIFYGPYVYHCHILDHEDNDMMRPIEVLPPLPADTLYSAYDAIERTISIQLGTTPGVSYEIQATKDLLSWQSLTNTVGTGMTFYYTDPEAYVRGQGSPPGPGTGDPWRLYRAVRSP